MIDAVSNPAIFTLLGWVSAIILWLAKEIYQSWKDKSSKATKIVEGISTDLRQIEKSLASLEVEMRLSSGLSKEIPKLQRDVDVAHSHLRLIAPQLYSPPTRAASDE